LRLVIFTPLAASLQRPKTLIAKGYALAPQRALIMAGGMNAAIEAHSLSLAGTWLSRVTSEMEQEPQILREKERYLSFKGQYQESAEVGGEAIKVLPRDRDVVVYLGYDLLHLEKIRRVTRSDNEVWQHSSQRAGHSAAAGLCTQAPGTQ